VIRTAVKTLGKHRVIFGSDTPYLVMQMELEKVTKYCGLTEDEVDTILGENSAQLLGYNVEPDKLPKVKMT
jgi:predicted TIM-barrel fold metal-dependent hydrolase